MRNLLILTFLLFNATFLSAQFSIGGKAGINLAEWKEPLTFTDANGNPYDNELLLGYNFGLLAEIGMDDHFFIQPELNLIQKGFSAERKEDDFNSELVFQLTNIDLVALAKYKVVGNVLGGYLAAGPQLGYLISGKTKLKTTDNGETDNSDEKIDLNLYNRTEFGIAFGGGLVVPIEDGPEIFLDARYLLGLTATLKENDFFDFNSKNRGINISIGALFELSSSN